MLGKFFESLYLKVFVNIVVGSTKSTVYIELCRDDHVINSQEEIFETSTLSAQMFEFINSYTAETPYFYVSILDISTSQGAVPTCVKSELSKYIGDSDIKAICSAKKWTYYTSKAEMSMIQNRYAKIGIDFIFSPFTLLSEFFKDKIDTHTAMFILLQENSLSLAIFDKSELLFAEHLDMQSHVKIDDILMDDNEDLELSLDEDVEVDDFESLDNMEILDDFGDIEDLDTIADIDEFSASNDIEEELSQDVQEESSVENSESFNEDYQRFLLIQSAINNFYKDKRYKSTFIEAAYIADSVGVSSDLKKYLEEEMFLSAYLRHIDLSHELCDIAKREVQS